MWACCRPERATRRRRPARLRAAAGFTLLELLVVLLVVGLVSALVVPNLGNLVGGLQRATSRDGLVADLSALSYRAHSLGQAFELDAEAGGRLLRDGNPVLALPSGWQLRVERPIRFTFEGFCEGGEVELVSPDGRIERLRLLAPDGRVAPA